MTILFNYGRRNGTHIEKAGTVDFEQTGRFRVTSRLLHPPYSGPLRPSLGHRRKGDRLDTDRLFNRDDRPFALGLLFWRRGGRGVLKGFYFLAIVIGLVGFWYHTNGKPVRAVKHDLSAWIRKIPDEDKPPAFAPLAFAGFGLLGVLACAKRFQPPTVD